MPATTYLRAGEFTAATSNAILNELLRDVRKLTGEDWRIAERVSQRRRLLRQTTVVRSFELYVGIEPPRDATERQRSAGELARSLWGRDGEFQVINFYREHDWSINHANSAEHVAAYLFGVVSGYHTATKGAGPAAA